jgi:hypothetical protein
MVCNLLLWMVDGLILLRLGGKVTHHDPKSSRKTEKRIRRIELPFDASGASCVLLTEDVSVTRSPVQFSKTCPLLPVQEHKSAD